MFTPVLAADHDELIEFLSSVALPPHDADLGGRGRGGVAAGRYYRDADDAPHWIEVRGERVGLLVIRELSDPTPVFDLRLRRAWRGRGLAASLWRGWPMKRSRVTASTG